MPLTPEQLDLQAAIERCIANPSADNHATVKTMTSPRAILALLAQIKGCNEDYGQAVDSVAKLQEEVFAVRAQMEALRAAVAKLIKAKGRFHTEQNYVALVAAFDGASGDEAAQAAPTRTDALQELADQAQELGMGYGEAPRGRRKILMPSGMIDVTPEPVAKEPSQ